MSATFVTCDGCRRLMLGQRRAGAIYPQPHDCQPLETTIAEELEPQPLMFTYEPGFDAAAFLELFAPTLYWVYIDGRCVGTGEPDGQGSVRIYALPRLWQDDGDQA